ncbi:hypothetical protein [Thalassospira mesophila]|uniref:AsmA domain-containing protein n=1 Tax=Thalassospira mesophila TaxID=1293891 RepID=A0A1Y2L2J0_9PROT|nr:hypothetical protein [Thalassospira mesophila]OSQ39555.1 hypothetical protein TMES_05940 [Thalassospira mesophila]
MRKILIGLTIIILIVVGFLVYLYANLDTIVKSTIEEAGTRVTQAEVTVDAVKIETTQNTAEIKGLKIGNPAGFYSEQAFALGDISVVIDGSSLTEPVIHVEKVTITAPSIIYEVGDNTSNIATIQRNVESFISRVSGPAGENATRDADDINDEQGGTRVVIDHVYIENGSVAISASFLGGKKLSTSLPSLHLTDIGRDTNGATPAQVAEKVLSAMNSAVINSVSQLNMDGLMQGVGDFGKSLAAPLGALGTAPGSTGADGGNGALKKGSDALGSAMKGLLGGKSD